MKNVTSNAAAASDSQIPHQLSIEEHALARFVNEIGNARRRRDLERSPQNQAHVGPFQITWQGRVKAGWQLFSKKDNIRFNVGGSLHLVFVCLATAVYAHWYLLLDDDAFLNIGNVGRFFTLYTARRSKVTVTFN